MEHSRWLSLVAALSDPDVSVALGAVKSIQDESTIEDLPSLIQLLDHEDFFIREAAAWPLAWLAGSTLLPQLFTAYQRGFDQGHDNDGFTAALLEIPALFPVEAKTRLEALATQASEPIREYASWLLEFVPQINANDA